MKRKNGFTLIELLAIIVILAVIALITIPKITHMVRYSKEKAVVDSAYGFKNAVNNYYMTELLDAPGLDFNGEYSVIPTSVGAVLRGESEFNVSFSGTAPRGGNIIIDDDDIYGKIQFDDYCVDLSTMVAKKGECSSSLICEYGTESIDYYVLNTVNVTYNEKLIDSCVAIIDDYGFEGDSRAFCKGNYFQGNDIVGLASFESSLAQRLVNAGVLTENDIPEPSTKKHIIEDNNHNKISSLEYYLEDYSASSIGFYSQRYVLNTVSKTLRNQKIYNSCSDYMYDFGFARDQDDVYNLCTDENLINSLVVNNSLDSSQISTLVSSGILTKEGNHEVCSDGITISFNYDDGICDDCYMKVIASGSKVGSLPTVTGNKEFVGWGYGDDQLVTSDTVFYEDTELHAMWLYSKVIFYANGGECSNCNVVYVIPGAPIGNLPTPTKAGFTFDGWYENGNKISSTTIVNGDTLLFANWKYYLDWNSFSFGSHICLIDGNKECFTVISKDDASATLLADNNLNPSTGFQGNDGGDYPVAFSSITYWTLNQGEYDYSNIYDPVNYAGLPGTNSYSIAYYVNLYVNNLRNRGASYVTGGKVLTKADYSNYNFAQRFRSSGEKYWLATVTSSDSSKLETMFCDSYGDTLINPVSYYSTSMRGVRPAIIISNTNSNNN